MTFVRNKHDKSHALAISCLFITIYLSNKDTKSNKKRPFYAKYIIILKKPSLIGLFMFFTTKQIFKNHET
jgi:hypothetical protein